MRAQLLYRSKSVLSDGAIQELIVWKVAQPVPGSAHDYKYSLFYGYPGQRVVGYDNERGKGDHKHLDGNEEAYAFSTVERLLEDFRRDVDIRRSRRR
ncbi:MULTISPECIES: toxin-antitoxin system TumE family protein [unclassified Rhizobium]|uniref:toxin-antitoxin system TumE family protein n=1 Tax=unclassified Rhizobium TaxID=2613769 RepID=UPI001ADB2103|nr:MULTISPECIES: DUF6516 family protein [unclassified Rhizobium]MBO9123350.1 hypothetical protein [Rhizobium sp. 16-488-2b]MBO9173882.1 hypothetical protein [Rhizobium sp. 16-488-2a]